MTSTLVRFSRIDSKLFMYFVDAPGQEKLKAYQSIEAYYYYQRLVALNSVYIHFCTDTCTEWLGSDHPLPQHTCRHCITF